jgi:hypothetical protein
MWSPEQTAGGYTTFTVLSRLSVELDLLAGSRSDATSQSLIDQRCRPSFPVCQPLHEVGPARTIQDKAILQKVPSHSILSLIAEEVQVCAGMHREWF